jgi:uncharacterized protein YndB with AHSA1/START domain
MSTFSTQRALPHSTAQVFAALRAEERLARWWGPEGFANRFEVFEFKVGGRWVFDMIGPDGTVYPNASTFTHIEEGKEVLIEHVCEPRFELRITLEPAASGTLLHWSQNFADATVAEAVRHIVVPANEQNLDRLQAELAAHP